MVINLLKNAKNGTIFKMKKKINIMSIEGNMGIKDEDHD